jgi:lipid-binding SYLF domain-containing protein
MHKSRVLYLAVGCLIVGCAAAPKTAEKQNTLKSQAAETVAQMTADDPSLQSVLDQAAGYVVFPSVKEGGFIVGGAGAEGVVFERGAQVGFAELSRASVGAQVGGQKYSEVLVLQTQEALQRVKTNTFDFGAEASAVAVRAGAASTANFSNGAAAFVKPIGGAMLNVSLTGQRIKFSG